PLARRQAIELSDLRWRHDVDHLIEMLRQRPSVSEPPQPPEPVPPALRPTVREMVVTTLASTADCLVVSPDNRHVAWRNVEPRVIGPDRVSLVIDNATRWTGEDSTKAVFSPDSCRFAHAVRAKGGWCFLVDGREGPPCDSLFRDRPGVFDRDSQ